MAQRRGDGGLPADGDEVRGDEPGRALGDRPEVDAVGGRDVDQQPAQQLGTRPQVRQGQAELAVGEVGGPQAGVDRLGRRGGGHQREVGGRDGGAESVEDEGGERGRVGGGQQGVDVGEQHDDRRVGTRRGPRVPEHLVHACGGGRRFEGGDARGRDVDAAGADGGGSAAHEGRLAHALGTDDEHPEPGVSRRGW